VGVLLFGTLLYDSFRLTSLAFVEEEENVGFGGVGNTHTRRVVSTLKKVK